MSKKKILVADDDPDIVRGLMLRLTAAGYQVTMANDGIETTRKAIAEQPDLILLDIGMPAGNGHVVVERLRNISDTCNIPVIYLTARCAQEDYQRARAGGVAKYITKPFDPDILLAAVEQEIENSCPAN